MLHGSSMEHELETGASVFDSDNVSVLTTAKKKKTKRKKKLYEQYLADSGSDESHVSSLDEPENVIDCEEFTVGMDINVLIHQTVQNIIQSVCLEDEDGISGFSDHELICFAAAVKNNSSILSIQIRYLEVSDVSLVPLCKALEVHPNLRALDFSGTRGGGATSRALTHLVCTNSSIIFARVDDTVVSSKDAEVVQEAMRYNALACPDPSNNPFDLGLLRKISSMGVKEYKFTESLQARAWLVHDGGGFVVKEKEEPAHKDDKKKSKKVGFRVNEATKFGGEVCAQYVQGKCSYGSRCKYVHPERTSALKNSASLLQHDVGDSVSVGFSTALSSSSTKTRLQSRLRPSHFSLGKVATKVNAGKKVNEDTKPTINPSISEISLPFVASLWTLSFTVFACCTVLALTS